MIKNLTVNRGLEQEEGLTNYTKRSDTIRVAGATPLTTPMFRQITEIGFFEKINLVWFWRPQKLFDQFWKSKNSVICLNMQGGQGSGPSHPDGVGPGVIC